MTRIHKISDILKSTRYLSSGFLRLIFVAVDGRLIQSDMASPAFSHIVDDFHILPEVVAQIIVRVVPFPGLQPFHKFAPDVFGRSLAQNISVCDVNHTT